MSTTKAAKFNSLIRHILRHLLPQLRSLCEAATERGDDYLGDYGSPLRDEALELSLLRQHKLGEADRIITLLTAEHGLVRAVAKGVRRTRSKFGARLEPWRPTNCASTRATASSNNSSPCAPAANSAA